MNASQFTHHPTFSRSPVWGLCKRRAMPLRLSAARARAGPLGRAAALV